MKKVFFLFILILLGHLSAGPEETVKKFIQDFKFGTNLIVNDISKVTGLKNDNIKNILTN